jgi:flagellar hook-associated protein 1 FlgK
VTLSGTGTALDPFVAEGLSIVVTTPPAAGDSFTLRPTRFGGSEIGLAIQSPRELAAASPVYGEAAAANTGSGTATQPLVVDPTDTNLLSTVNIVFETPPSTYTVNGGPSQAYTAGAAITVNGWSLNISGVPAAGDTFTVSANNGGVGDNRNALELVGLRNTDLMEGGGGPPTATFDEAYSQLVARVGVQSLAADTNADAQRVLLAQAEAERESVSGVNLDEEAADLLRFQQAYQAAAQVISVADSLFQTLLDATRR